MDADLAELARGLSKAQREVICSAPIGGNWFPVSWEGWRAIFGRSLQRQRLAFPRESGAQVLSPLGLRLRDYLQEHPHA